MLKSLFKKTKTEMVHVITPVSGDYVNIEDVPDPVFADKMVGDGAAVQPESANTAIVSPVRGKIIMLADTHHAIGIQAENGMELLIHIGLDTVELKGKGFKPHVSVDEKVETGQLLMEVDIDFIQASGRKTVIPIVVTNNEKNQYKLIKNEQKYLEAGKSILFSLEKS